MRNESISIAKAMGILLMVLAHTWFSQYASQWINMFHMPLFFFFAGYCFKEKYLESPIVFARKRVVGLYKPFVKWSLIFLLLHNVFYVLHVYDGEYGFMGRASHPYGLEEMVQCALHIMTRMTDNEQLLGGYWFLRSLLAGSLIGFMVIRSVRSAVVGGGILLAVTLALSYFNKDLPYFHVGDRETFAALFFIIGHAYKVRECKFHQKVWSILAALALVTIGACWLQTNMLQFLWWQVLPYAIVAVSGTLGTFYVASHIAQSDNRVKRMLVYVGNNTLTLLTWHFLSFKLVSLVIILTYQLPIARLAEFPVIKEYSAKGWFILYFVIGVWIPLALSKTKYLK